MQPASMLEHHREERQEIRGSEISVAATVSRRDEREARYQRVGLHRWQADLNREYRAIDCDQPSGERRISGRRRVLDLEDSVPRSSNLTAHNRPRARRLFIARRQIRLPVPSNHDDHQVLF
jgi:hypothetical protein